MATAPSPTRNSKRKGLKLTMNDETRILMMSDLGPQDDLAARKQTGLPVSVFLSEDAFAADSIAILWWVAGRKAGVKTRFLEMLKDFPNTEEIADMFTDGRLTITGLDEVEDDTAEVDEHPLPRADA